MSFVSARGPDEPYIGIEAAGEAPPKGFLAIKAPPTGYANPVPFGSGRWGREQRRKTPTPCKGCAQPLYAVRVQMAGYHDSCAAKLSAPLEAPGEVPVKEKRAPAPPRKLPRSEIGRPQLLIELGDQCYFCGDDLTAFTITREHLTPSSRGGANSGLNVVAACSRCNSMKGDMTEDEFTDWLRKVTRNMGLSDTA